MEDHEFENFGIYTERLMKTIKISLRSAKRVLLDIK
jgi:hypothetical protein